MVAFKILLAIVLIMSTTFNRPCSADLQKDCQKIIIRTFQDELGESVKPGCGIQCFKIIYNKLTIKQIRNNFYNAGSSNESEYDRDLKVDLMVDYVSKIYNPERIGGYLNYIEMKTANVWCSNKITEILQSIKDAKSGRGGYVEIGFMDNIPRKDMYKACLDLFQRISITEHSTLEHIFKVYFQNWTAETLNFVEVYEIADGLFLETLENRIKMFYIKKYLYNYYTYIKEKNNTLELFNTTRAGLNQRVPVLSILEYCDRFGKDILNNNNN